MHVTIMKNIGHNIRGPMLVTTKIMKSCVLVENTDVSSEEKDASITSVGYKTRYLHGHC
jgi:hypothetical protein